MKRVSEMLHNKADVRNFGVEPDTMIYEAIKLMDEKHIGAVFVMEGDNLVGIMSERDYVRKVALKGRSSHSTEVSQIMTPNPITVTTHETISTCMEIMNSKHIRHLPVVENGQLLGMISIGDIMHNMLEDQQHTIVQMEQYIRGESY